MKIFKFLGFYTLIKAQAPSDAKCCSDCLVTKILLKNLLKNLFKNI